VVNVDDARGAVLAGELRAEVRAGLALWTVSRRGAAGGAAARLQARALRQAGAGLAFDLVEDDRVHLVTTSLLGDYNVDNLRVVAACLRALGVPLADVAAALGPLPPVPGRMQAVRLDGAAPGLPEVVVDYAHTPDALEQALAALAPRAAARGGALWCVFGCGGDRDATKRPLMGAVAARAAQRVVVTSDNPRSEPAGEIVRQVLAGTAGGSATVQSIEDRRAAIAQALREAAPADLVLIAGKGHEDTQEIAGFKHPFSDIDEALRGLRLRASAEGRA
jgi:UDP-N-acetylmuramoyl-L-alanyl-D-glutamate--2,6-diaminopimelate ligase